MTGVKAGVSDVIRRRLEALTIAVNCREASAKAEG